MGVKEISFDFYGHPMWKDKEKDGRLQFHWSRVLSNELQGAVRGHIGV